MIMDYGGTRVFQRDPAWVSPRRIQGGISSPQTIDLVQGPNGQYSMPTRTQALLRKLRARPSPWALAAMLGQLGADYYGPYIWPEAYQLHPGEVKAYHLGGTWRYPGGTPGSCDPALSSSGLLRGWRDQCYWCRTPGHFHTASPPVYNTTTNDISFWRFYRTNASHNEWIRVGRFKRDVGDTTAPVPALTAYGLPGLRTDPSEWVRPVSPRMRRILERHHPHNNSSGYHAPTSHPSAGSSGSGNTGGGGATVFPPHIRVPPGKNVRENKKRWNRLFAKVARLALATTEWIDFVDAVADAWNWDPSKGPKIPFIWNKWMTASDAEIAAALEKITANFLEDNVIGRLSARDPTFDQWLRANGFNPDVWYINIQ